MADLHPFSGLGPRCPKCLFDDVTFAYHPAGTGLASVTGDGEVVLVQGHGLTEWMLRTCRVCGYAWAEATADR